MTSSAPKKTPIRIAHYGTGKNAKSPVMITLPAELGDQRFVANAEFAECFYDAYETVDTAAEFQEFKRDLNYLRNSVNYGNFSDLEGAMRECLHHWRKRSICGYFEASRRTVEEQNQDLLGELAAWAEIDVLPQGRSAIYGDWHESYRVITAKRVAIDSALALAAMSLLTYLGVSSGDWEWVMALMLFPLLFRFTSPLTKAMEVTAFHWRAYELYPGTAKEKKPFVMAMVKGATDEELYCMIRDRLDAKVLAAESEKLAKTIADELASQEELLALEEAKVVPANPLLSLGMETYESPLEATVTAQRALLEDLKARNLELQH